MTNTPFPPAMQYFFALWKMEDEFGGMTTMSLHRACIFLEEAGISAPLLTFEPRSGYERQLDLLHGNGTISTRVTILNPYVHYRSAEFGTLNDADLFRPVMREPSGETIMEYDDDGSLFRRITLHADGSTVALREYFRRDGTEYLYDENPVNTEGDKSGRVLTLVTGSGQVVGRWGSAGDFYRDWVIQLTGGCPTTVIVDSAYASRVIAPIRAENIIKMVVVHNAHVASGGDPVRGKIDPHRRSIFAAVNDWDGIVFLTDEQRHDYMMRFGNTANLFTISNPQQRARSIPDFAQRSGRRGVLLGRLVPQKNLRQAIRVMAKARKIIPDVTLDIYGKGPDESDLNELISVLDLSETVHLRGHAPEAAEQFDVARFSLLTSRNEGQPLALMESQGRGCVPVAYSIRYGPRDIIEDGISGYLVEPGDTESAAARIVSLCTDDALAKRMGHAAWDSAERFSNRSVVARWLAVVGQAWHQRDRRTQVQDMHLRVEEFAWLRLGAVEASVRLNWKQVSGPSLENLLSVSFVMVPRSTGPAIEVPAVIEETSAGTVLATARIEPRAWSSDINVAEEFLDVFCKVAGADVAAMFRVSYPGEQSFLPFVTQDSGLRLRNVGPG